ncbi:hypothetical protein BGX28_004432 [Mortierella sp. GBA30]|nr:hypothetical protein BGX28_004432 [Mortierella sp. GBA30]
MARLLALGAAKKQPSFKGQRRPTVTLSLSPLDLPEILHNIFAFLSPWALKNSVRLVCKQWYSIARPLIPVRALWKDRTRYRYKHSFVLNRLHQANILQVLFEQSWQLDNTTFAWRELIEKVETLQASNQLQIKRLELLRGNFLESRIYLILPKIVTLTEIWIEKLVQETIHVGTILRLCPQLRMLHIDGSASLGYHEIEIETNRPPRRTDAYPSTLISSRLRRMTIKWMHIQQATLETIVNLCPELQTLRLVELNRAKTQIQSFDRVHLYSMIAASCSRLRWFHLSFREQSMTAEDAQAMHQTFFPRLQVPHFEANLFSTEPTYSRRTPTSPAPSLEALSLLCDDIHPNTTSYLRQPYIGGVYVNRLTTLEIVLSDAPKQWSPVSDALHHLLCDSPSLLHLFAPTVPYYPEYLDLEGEVDSDGYYCPRGCDALRQRSEDLCIKKKIWACRDLRTLQIQFTPLSVQDCPSAANSRIMFGYVAKVCPELRELWVKRSQLCLELDGGLCLLSRLRKLERLRIWTKTRTSFGKKDIEWMAVTHRADRLPHRAQRSIEQWIARSQLTFPDFSRSKKASGRNTRHDDGQTSFEFSQDSNSRVFGPDSKADGKLTVEDMEGVGSKQDVEAWLKRQTDLGHRQRHRCGPNEYEGSIDICWPRLEYLSLCFFMLHNHKVVQCEDHLPALFAKIRPHIEFNCSSRWP